MTIVPLRPERVEIVGGVIRGDDHKTWFLELIEAGQKEGTIVAELASEEQVFTDALLWDLPVFRRH